MTRGHSALANHGRGRGRLSGEQFLSIGRLHHRNSAITHLLREGRIERHQFRVDFHRVTIDRGKERRIGQVQIGLIERDLRSIDGF